MGLRLRAVGGSGRELGLGSGLRYSGGFRLGLRHSLGYASFGYFSPSPPSASRPPPSLRGFCFAEPQSFCVTDPFGPLPPPPPFARRRLTGTLLCLPKPWALSPAQNTTIYPPLALSPETAQHAAERKGERVGLGLRTWGGLGPRLVEATVRYSGGPGMEVGEGHVAVLGPGPGLGRFSLLDFGVSPPLFPITPPPKGVIVSLERPARRAGGVILCAPASLGLRSMPLAGVRHSGMAKMSSIPRGGCLPPLWVEIKTCPLTALPCSPPSLPPSPLPPLSPLLFCFSHLSTPQWRQVDKSADNVVVLVSPPPPPSLFPFPSPPDPPLPPEPPPPGVASLAWRGQLANLARWPSAPGP